MPELVFKEKLSGILLYYFSETESIKRIKGLGDGVNGKECKGDVQKQKIISI